MNKSTKLNEMLKARYELDLLEGRLIPSHLEAIVEHYEQKRDILKETLSESLVHSSSEYTKAYLISEAAKMILREIKPKRTKRKETK